MSCFSSSSSLEIVYAQKLLNRDLHRLTCDSLKEKNEKYLSCDDGWLLKEHGKDYDDDDDGDRRRQKDDRDHEGTLKVGSKIETKFRQVWIQGFVVEYVEAKDWLLVDDGTGSPWTVVHAAKNPTSINWLKDANGSFEASEKKFYVQVLGEPVLLKDGKRGDLKTIHIAAIKAQNLTSRLPSFSLDDVDASCRSRVEAAFESFNSFVDSDAEKLQLYQWMLEVEHMKLRRLMSR